jgi:hypothetical protein
VAKVVATTFPRSAPIAGAAPAARPNRRWRALLSIVAGLALFMLLDAVFFRSGFYFEWVSPDSGVGALLNVTRAIETAPNVDGGVIVFGNSRMAEGFSANIANKEAEKLGVSTKFFNSAVPGTSPRVWYYMLRNYRDRGLHPAAVAYMADSLNDNARFSDTETVSDIAFVNPYLGWKDIATFPMSFQKPAAREEALEAVLFKGRLLGGDFEDFLRHPELRINSVKLWRMHGGEWLSSYSGRDQTLAGLTLDLATGAVGWGPGEANLPQGVRGYIDGLKRQRKERAPPEAAQFAKAWYGAAAALCREMGAKLIVFRGPRGPLHYLAPSEGEPHGALADLAAAGELRLIPANTFDDLEHPQFFFDHLHMNRVGREAFSPRLARETLQILAR